MKQLWQKARFRSAGNSWKANENENVLHGGKWKKVERGILILVKELVIFSIKGKIGPNWIDPIFELFVLKNRVDPLYLKNRAMAD